MSSSTQEVEDEFGVGEEPFATEEQLRPADIEPVVRGIAEIGGAAIGVGVSTFRLLGKELDRPGPPSSDRAESSVCCQRTLARARRGRERPPPR